MPPANLDGRGFAKRLLILRTEMGIDFFPDNGDMERRFNPQSDLMTIFA